MVIEKPRTLEEIMINRDREFYVIYCHKHTTGLTRVFRARLNSGYTDNLECIEIHTHALIKDLGIKIIWTRAAYHKHLAESPNIDELAIAVDLIEQVLGTKKQCIEN